MKRLLRLLAFGFCLFALGCSKGPTAEEQASLAAKGYYDHLLAGEYDHFMEGKYGFDTISASYREQLTANAKQFVAMQKDKHRGIREVRVSNARMDSAVNVMQVFMVFCYGDSTNEEVLVPMVEHQGRWQMR